MTKDGPQTLGQRLRRLRLEAGLSQEELAERAGLTAAAIGSLERGERRHPYPHTMSALAEALRLDGAARIALFDSVPSRRESPTSRHETAGDQPKAPDAHHGLTRPPAPLTPILGREHEIAAIDALLRQPGVRLATLTGPGGVGKTRLATELAARAGPRYGAGAVWIDLQAVPDAGSVLPAIGRGLGIPEARDADASQLLAGSLRRMQVLMVLDNFEHVIDASASVADLLQRCPSVDAVVTSREALRIRGEHEVQLAPLGVPDAHAAGVRAVAGADAVRLLLERVRAAVPSFELSDANAADVAALCARLDGLPLALELAAGQLRYVSPRELLERIDHDRAVLGGGARDLPARQQSLEATLRWSHDLLTEPERTVFRRLAVFSGGFTRGAAAIVCADGVLSEADALASLAVLVDKSLVQVGFEEELRYRMLETVRQYALTWLHSSSEANEVRGRHAAHYAAAATEAERHLQEPARLGWLRRLEVEGGNLRVALEHSARDGDPCVGVQLTGALAWFWLVRGGISEAERWSTTFLAVARRTCQPVDVASTLYASAAAAWKRGDLERARAHADESVALLRTLEEPRRLALALAVRGLVAVSSNQLEAAARFHSESLAVFREIGHRWGTAYARSNLGDVLFEQRHLDLAGREYRLALDDFRNEGDPWGEAIVRHALGNIALSEGEVSAGLELYAASVDLCRALGNMMEAARSLIGLAAAALASGDPGLAERSLTESSTIWRDFENRDGVATCLAGLAAVAAVRGRDTQAVALLRESRQVCRHPALYVVDPALFDGYLEAASVALGDT